MIITITKNQGPILITFLHLHGKLDGANYESLINEAQKVYAAGARDLILDLSKLTYISSAGLTALHRVALLFRGEKRPNQDEGWAAYHAIDRDRGRGVQAHVKLFGPTEAVQHVLDLTGFSDLFEIYTDSQQAAISFRQPTPAIETRLP